MTTYKKIYNPNKDERPKLVSIGVSLITHEVHHLIQDDRHIEIPVDDEVIYLTADYDVAFTNTGEADYERVALLAEEQGYPMSHWQVRSVWLALPPDTEF